MDASGSPARRRSSSGGSRCWTRASGRSRVTRTDSAAGPGTWRSTARLGKRSSVAEGKGKRRRSLHEAFGQEAGDTAHLPNPSQWPHNVYDPSHYLGAYVPASRDEEAILRRSL